MTLCVVHGISNCGVRDCPPIDPDADALIPPSEASDHAVDWHRDFNECWRAKKPTLAHVEKTLLYALK